MFSKTVPSILTAIVESKYKEIAKLKESDFLSLPINKKNFRKNLEKLYRTKGLAIIAECKKGSPSQGIIQSTYNPVVTAKNYQAGGAAAISVLTDTPFFYGSLQDLQLVSQTLELPILRKDFIVDKIQIKESRFFGASAILLIASLLEVEQLKQFRIEAEALGMDALVEVHNKKELKKAIKSGAHIIGINNRNLHDFSVNLNTTVDLTKTLKRMLKKSNGKINDKEVLLISESAIKTKNDINFVRPHINGVLIGTALMKGNENEMLKEFLNEYPKF